MVHLVYPPLKVGDEYALGTAEAPGREVARQSPMEMLGGSTLAQVWRCVAAWNMEDASA